MEKWGPYLSERQWGTVREDYSEDGNAWNYCKREPTPTFPGLMVSADITGPLRNIGWGDNGRWLIRGA